MPDRSASHPHTTDQAPGTLGRRHFLGASGALGAGLALGGLAGATPVSATPAGAATPANTSGAPTAPGGEPATRPLTSPVKSSDIVHLDALDLSRAIKHRQVSCTEVMQAYLDHIHEVNPHVNAIVGMQDPELSLAQARERDGQLKRGEYLGWMHGFPHAVKDLAASKGLPFTMGSPIFKDRVATDDALFVQRIKSAGAVVIGKTNTPEWGLGSQTYNPVWGTTGNAYDPTRTAGGSSGGAASALALRMLPVADGSDYMGSLRNPAAFNNVLGFRPSWGRVPFPGFIAQPVVTGPMARTAADTAALLSVMAGPDPSAALGIDEDPAVFRQSLDRDFRGTRIAWIGDWNGYLATEPEVLDLCRGSFAAFESIGCTVEEKLPDFAPEKIWSSFLTWRWWSNLNLYDFYKDPAMRKLLKPEAVWEVEHGIPLSALDITAASTARDLWYAAVMKMFETYDYILAPSAQVFPFDKETHWPHEIDGRPMDTYHRWMETVAPWSLTNLPTAGMPVGFDRRGLPTGVQLIGKDNADLAVLQLAHAYEQATRWTSKVTPSLLK
ncbi:amidase [Streptomyces sp. NPDC046821]|uniref:amidase n=1 Tax=Streptomyces sp. NPDC046821 TaxID=3154702 RepID=UPI0033F07B02